MTEYLEFEHVLLINQDITGQRAVRDSGLIHAAVERPKASAFGEDAYPTIWEKAAALLQSLARNHGFIDGNKRTAWLAAMTFLDINGHETDRRPDQRAMVDLMLAVAQGQLSEVQAIGSALVKFTRR